jgi:hypothetical protein
MEPIVISTALGADTDNLDVHILFAMVARCHSGRARK